MSGQVEINGEKIRIDMIAAPDFCPLTSPLPEGVKAPVDIIIKEEGMSIHAGSYETSPKLNALFFALSDGQWHTARELRERSGGAVEAVSARIQELKAEPNKLNIECKKIDGQYRYRLVAGPETSADVRLDRVSPAGQTEVGSISPSTPSAPPQKDIQSTASAVNHGRGEFTGGGGEIGKRTPIAGESLGSSPGLPHKKRGVNPRLSLPALDKISSAPTAEISAPAPETKVNCPRRNTRVYVNACLANCTHKEKCKAIKPYLPIDHIVEPNKMVAAPVGEKNETLAAFRERHGAGSTEQGGLF